MRAFILACLIVLIGSVWAASPEKAAAKPNKAVEANDPALSPEQLLDFFDSFEAYTAGIPLTGQTTNWTTWSGTPGTGEDPLVSNAQAHTGTNSVVIIPNNDLVKTLGSQTSGKWLISFYIYIPTGKAGYFNTLAGFTPNPFNWGMECYFDLGGGGRVLGGSATAVTFSWTAAAWHHVEVLVDLDTDHAEFWFNGSMVHSWTWTAGASGGGSPLRLDGNDLFGATANDEMYVDDYSVEKILPGVFFSDSFDGYTAGIKLALQNPVFWTTWSNAPGGPEDAFVSNAQAYSGANSVVIVQNNDLVKTFGSLTTGKWQISFQVYIPTGKAGYFNTLAGFTPNPFDWGMEVYFDLGGGGRLMGVPGAPVAFSWTPGTWQQVMVIVDLDANMAEFWFNGAMVGSAWQWTQGGAHALRLDANDLFGATANDEMYIDDYSIEDITVIVGIDDNGLQIPDEFALHQNFPNPFNPTTTIAYTLKENSQVSLKIYNTLGQLVKTLVNSQQEAGVKTVQWDGTNEFGAKVASGMYLYRLEANNFVQTKKMVLMK